MNCDENETVEEARARVFSSANFRANRSQPNPCPVCRKRIKLDRRLLRASLASLLCWIYRQDKDRDGYVDIQGVAPRETLRGKDYAILAYWELIAPSKKPEHQDTRKKGSGWWRLTDLGLRFVLCDLEVPTHVFVFGAECFGFEDKLMSIKEALESGAFDYHELMDGDYLGQFDGGSAT